MNNASCDEGIQTDGRKCCVCDDCRRTPPYCPNHKDEMIHNLCIENAELRRQLAMMVDQRVEEVRTGAYSSFQNCPYCGKVPNNCRCEVER